MCRDGGLNANGSGGEALKGEVMQETPTYGSRCARRKTLGWAAGVITCATIVALPPDRAALAGDETRAHSRDGEIERPGKETDGGSPVAGSAKQRKTEEVVVTIVYDNNAGRKDLTAAWGFACVIQGLEKTILFDTGGEGKTLLENMRRLGLDPKAIEVIVLSHIHGDHTGGLSSILRERSDIPVYMPSGFPSAFVKQVHSLGGQPQEATDSAVVCRGARTTGTLGRGAIEEQGLCVRTSAGWIMITGCAHPGVENLAGQARETVGESLHLVVGGCHLVRQSPAKINAVLDRLEELGVKRVAPCHCSGDLARRLFEQRYGDRCELAGVGSIFQFAPVRGKAQP